MKIKMGVFLFVALSQSSCQVQQESSSLNLSPNNFSIIGGEAAKEEDAVTKSTVAFFFNFEGTPYLLCTGTLISKNLILTAGHCVEYVGEGVMFAYFGSENPKTFGGEKFLAVKNWEIHPEYTVLRDQNLNSYSSINDIALVRLNEDAPLGTQPVPILDEGVLLPERSSLLLAGYGLVEDIGTPKEAVGLNYVEVPLHKTVGDILVTDQTGDKGACNGDSGGPAYIQSSEGLTVVGVTRGPTQDSKNCHQYGEYTRTSTFKEFIVEAAKKLSGDLPVFKK